MLLSLMIDAAADSSLVIKARLDPRYPSIIPREGSSMHPRSSNGSWVATEERLVDLRCHLGKDIDVVQPRCIRYSASETMYFHVLQNNCRMTCDNPKTKRYRMRFKL
jgi:hypothetical protein